MKIKKVLKYMTLLACFILLSGCGKKHSTTSYITENTNSTSENTSENSANLPYMAPATTVNGLNITDAILEKGINNHGNPVRIKEALDRASKGEPLTIAYIGGSITEGANASDSEHCYAYLTYLWFKETFPDSDITYINAGISDTDSWLGAHRLYEDVTSHNPDIVIIDFSADDGEKSAPEAYESIIRKLLESESEPAVIALLLAPKKGGRANDHLSTVITYRIPIISYAALLSGKLVKWKDVGDSDNIHPNDTGHQLISYLLTSYFRKVMSGKYDSFIKPYQIPVALCRYNSPRILYSDDFTKYDTDTFNPGEVWSPLSNKNGWYTTSAGSITFHIQSAEVSIIYKQTNINPEKNNTIYEVYMGNDLKGEICAYNPSIQGERLEYFKICLDGSPSMEEREFTLKPSRDNTGTDFTIIGIGVSGYVKQ